MKGTLTKHPDDGWVVEFYPNNDSEAKDYLQLHPDDVIRINEDSMVFDNIEARIKAYSDVEFDVVEVQKMDGISRYAKLKNT